MGLNGIPKNKTDESFYRTRSQSAAPTEQNKYYQKENDTKLNGQNYSIIMRSKKVLK